MGRKAYWVLLGALAIAAVLLNLAIKGPGLLVGGALWSLAAAPRLHDVGRSGWWAIGLWAFIVSALAAAWIVEPLMVAPMSFLAILLQISAAAWLGVAEGDPEANAFGAARASAGPDRPVAAS